MNTKTKFPGWLVGADRVDRDDPWIQLLIVNPFNGQTSTVLDQVIDLDEGSTPRVGVTRTSRTDMPSA